MNAYINAYNIIVHTNDHINYIREVTLKSGQVLPALNFNFLSCRFNASSAETPSASAASAVVAAAMAAGAVGLGLFFRSSVVLEFA
jgi:hypothetical protein